MEESWPSAKPPFQPSFTTLIGFPYGSTGALIDNPPWASQGGGTSPVMSTGPDETTDWIQASPNPGDNRDKVNRPFTAAPLTTELTLTFDHYYAPTVFGQDTLIELEDTPDIDAVVGLKLSYTGTGAGSLTTAEIYTATASSGDQPITLLPGQINAIKLTWDSTTAYVYVNGVLQATWLHVPTIPFNTIAVAYVSFHWVSGFGGDMWMKALTLLPGIL